MLRVLRVRWLSAAANKTLDGRRPGRGIYPVAVDEAVVGAAMARWTTALLKREEAMKGSWSSAVDERRPSLAVDDGVGVVWESWIRGSPDNRTISIGRAVRL